MFRELMYENEYTKSLKINLEKGIGSHDHKDEFPFWCRRDNGLIEALSIHERRVLRGEEYDCVVTHNYDNNGKLTKLECWLYTKRFSLINEYDSEGRVIKFIDSRGFEKNIIYYSGDKIMKYEDSNGFCIENSYDDKGALVAQCISNYKLGYTNDFFKEDYNYEEYFSDQRISGIR